MRDYIRRCAREYVGALLVKHDGCVRAAAREAGYSRTTFYRVLKRCGIEPPRTGTGARGNADWRALQ